MTQLETILTEFGDSEPEHVFAELLSEWINLLVNTQLMTGEGICRERDDWIDQFRAAMATVGEL